MRTSRNGRMSGSSLETRTPAALAHEVRTQTMVRIEAPANLAAGYTFEAVADGRAFLVTVPEGGVKAGQLFDVPLPPLPTLEMDSNMVTTAYPAYDDHLRSSNTNSFPDGGPIHSNGMLNPRMPEPQQVVMDAPEPSAPQGQWRNGLLSCCGVIHKEVFWCALCCLPLQTAQLANRLNLDWAGFEATPENARRTLLIIVVIFSITILFSEGVSEFEWYWRINAGLPVSLYLAWLLYRIRHVMRQRYSIEPSGTLSKCQHFLQYLLMLFCGCCGSIQMARHSHDEHKYPYDAFAPDGLPIFAPSIVDNS